MPFGGAGNPQVQPAVGTSFTLGQGMFQASGNAWDPAGGVVIRGWLEVILGSR